MTETRGTVSHQLIDYEYKYSNRCLSQLKEKLHILIKIETEMNRLIVEGSFDFDSYSLSVISSTLEEFNMIVEVIITIEKEFNTIGSNNNNKQQVELITSLGVSLVKEVISLNTVLTQLQLQVRKGNFKGKVEMEVSTTFDYLLEYGRTVLLEIIS
ncbi:hypothetical protein [Halalkalibacter akibai]|uniref:hypothetical protein n=1 Tax=Halalkalibacter akibai TaxID=1411 RepID=UPI0005519655|nr:hypothetical protein [Halalkalibacter akibai]